MPMAVVLLRGEEHSSSALSSMLPAGCSAFPETRSQSRDASLPTTLRTGRLRYAALSCFAKDQPGRHCPGVRCMQLTLPRCGPATLSMPWRSGGSH